MTENLVVIGNVVGKKLRLLQDLPKFCDRVFAPSIKDKGLGSRGTINVDPFWGIKV